MSWRRHRDLPLNQHKVEWGTRAAESMVGGTRFIPPGTD